MNDIDIKKKEVKAFFKKYNKKFQSDESSKIQDLENLLSKKISKSLRKSIESEIKEEKLQEEALIVERRDLFCSIMKYIWNEPNKENLLIIKGRNSENSYRNNDGRYEMNVYYDFSGPLGELMSDVSNFGDTGEVYFMHEENRKLNFNNRLTYEQFKELFLNNFVDYVEDFKKSFKKADNL